MSSTTTGQHHRHTESSKLEDQAASAALYATKESSSKQSSHPLLDEDGKLSSAGAATSLKYAKAQDLPSFPTVGTKMSSAGAAASLADSNKKSFEYWKPASIPAANKAAMLAKDYEMDPLWQPVASAAGSKAAIQASREGANVNIWHAQKTTAGQSAADQAMHKKPPGAITERELGADAHKKALMAATGAMSLSRRRADSAPAPPPGDAAGALKAANSVKGIHGGEFTKGDPGFEAARIQNMSQSKMSRGMYGSTPPVAIEIEERNRQATLRASAIAMAQKMYAVQQAQLDEAKAKHGTGRSAANAAHRRTLSDDSDEREEEDTLKSTAPRYANLEEAARKLAQERLAKLHDEHAEYKSYYGQSSVPKSRLSRRGRASSDEQWDDDADAEQSRRIKAQMSIFQTKLEAVDSKKRQTDREALMAAAQRNVSARMSAMDEKVFEETGKPSPQQRQLWEKEAMAKAQRESDDRMVNHGKVNIGGGKYMDQADVDAIARARLQPTLDEIAEKAEKQRARDEEIRLEQERLKQEAEFEKARQAEIKADFKRSNEKDKQMERDRKMEEKRVRDEQKATEKERIAAEKERLRLEKEEKRKSKDTKGRGLPAISTTSAAKPTEEMTPALAHEEVADEPIDAAVDAKADAPDEMVPAGEGETVHEQVTLPRHAQDELEQDKTHYVAPVGEEPGVEVAAQEPEEPAATTATTATTTEPVSSATPAAEAPATSPRATGTPTSASKGDSKVKSWLKSRFRSSSKAQNEVEEKSAFVGGSTLTGARSDEEKPRPDSVRDVAMAGKTTSHETDDLYGDVHRASEDPTTDAAHHAKAQSPDVSPLSEDNYDPDGLEASAQGPAGDTLASEPERGRAGFSQRQLPTFSSTREGKTDVAANETNNGGDDEFEEARDTFDEKKLAPPPKLTTIIGEEPGHSAKTASPKGSRERSKFTEEL